MHATAEPGHSALLGWKAAPDEVELQRPSTHHLKGQLGVVNVRGASLNQWQYEATGAKRIWYAIDLDTLTLWITRVGAGYQKRQTLAAGSAG